MSRIMTVSETATYLRMNRMTIYRLAQEGKIPAFKVGGSWRFDRQGIDEWIARQVETRQASSTKG
jgi:excisionase family DNA binding protein